MKLIFMQIVFVLQLLCETLGSKSEKLLNGQPVNILEYDFVVSVRHREIHICIGTILSSKFILTSAQCVCPCIPHHIFKYSIQFDTQYIYGHDNIVGVKNITCHEEFRHQGNVQNDLAILELVQPMKRGSWYSVAVASELFLTNFGIGDSFSLGWGENLKFYQNDLLIKGRSICEEFYGVKNLICAVAVDYSRYTINDFGAPLMKMDVQIGLFSMCTRLDQPSTDDNPMGFTLLSPYFEWITRNSNYGY